jgi:hypothetical protein
VDCNLSVMRSTMIARRLSTSYGDKAFSISVVPGLLCFSDVMFLRIQSAQPAYVGGAAETNPQTRNLHFFFGFAACSLLNAKIITGISYLAFRKWHVDVATMGDCAMDMLCPYSSQKALIDQ